MDWLKKLFNEPSTLAVIFSSAVIGLAAGFANGLIQRRHGGWAGFLGVMATGMVVAVIVGLGVQDYVKAETLRLAIVGVCAVIAEDIWNGLKTFGNGLRTDPLGSIARLIDALRGKSSAPSAPSPTPRGDNNADPTPMRRYDEKES